MDAVRSCLNKDKPADIICQKNKPKDECENKKNKRHL